MLEQSNSAKQVKTTESQWVLDNKSDAPLIDNKESGLKDLLNRLDQRIQSLENRSKNIGIGSMGEFHSAMEELVHRNPIDPDERCNTIKIKNQEYNKDLFMKLNTNNKDNDLKNNFRDQVRKAIDKIIDKPMASKMPIEKKLDEFFLEYLPNEFIKFSKKTDTENDFDEDNPPNETPMMEIKESKIEITEDSDEDSEKKIKLRER